MRLEISCDDRLGLCQDILQILRDHEIDLRGIEVDPRGKIFLNFPELAFADFQHLMPEIRRIPNVKDVKTVPFMPSEREHFEFSLLLSKLPDPVLSMDSKGIIDIANQAAQNVFVEDTTPIQGSNISDWLSGFAITRWLEKQPREATVEQVSVGGAKYFADLLPVWVTDELNKESFAGAVMTCKSQPVTGYWARGGNAEAFQHLVGEHATMKRVIRDAARMAELNVPLLIQGETGVGKELLARACHQASTRSEQAFLAVNCAALPDNVAESELFGHGKGSVSPNSERKMGIFEQANGGTVLLDSVGEMSNGLQAKLLRFIQDGRFRRIGEEQEVTVDVRIVCSAQDDLLERVEAGTFREDLFYRLNVLTLAVPALRDRKTDIPLLAEHFAAQACQRLGRSLVTISRSCRDYLQRYQWPGNVRQLENTLFRSISMLEGDRLEPEHIQLPEWATVHDNLAVDLEDGTLDDAVKKFESTILRRLYPSYPSTRQLARKLGLSHTAVANKLREHGIGKQRRKTTVRKEK
ncbi:transcriptional regulator of aroF, aroG, tyrA and aromatic amino acid transport [Pseudidiomarina planktonica]|uniref:HTH-type transcriptional regulatory protein TyrR n=1 Tax=Pseudidiomarina planktonica TaxID=1323738 RepID=A0A1Y6EWZ8_9GAMM|nr:transcriptional regulator TyrR [Pseudidiomarina planktonica]RUO65484.1 transcriptional regulator TyrR [Pseudidiomarina planktonica]SMQ64803.1 transcriptional regulator of aroF, aroG, tyrA and aromatic amino acid transport [Pseudidiomarina planktonica]